MDYMEYLDRYLFYFPVNAHQSMEHVKEVVGDVGTGMDALGTVLGLTNDDKRELEYMASQVPFIGDLITARDNYNYITDYMRNRGLSWEDMRYPSRVTGSGSGYYGAVSFVSDNIKRLYG